MKTIKIFLSIAGFALTTISFGQLPTGSQHDIADYTVYYNSFNNRIEQMVYRYPAGITPGDHFEAPLNTSNYFLPLENDQEVEPWMTSPFECSMYEEDLQIESWMLSPFESNYYETEIATESWMLSPFESNYYETEIATESWMTHPWI